ncbi:SCO family protein [Mariniflexile litorale]|uniref:SCO family protein n=1 Tax=Mariniflexile litorale TaxID=3045158 RepID=A0AAU7ELD5_9FLAO|nr:SCO family protein [Mariniflexile sp. KMM 9835]MDQ8212734.1 SCO family protein [Mariniflexile sp. KMM 9835]
MKFLKYIAIVLIVVLSVLSCNSGNKSKDNTSEVYQCPMQCEGDKIYDETGNCPVCKMDLALVENNLKTVDDGSISEASIFNLTSNWHTEEGKTIQLENLKGKTLVMVMIYTSCKAACPRLVADMRNIEAQIPDEKIKNIQFVMVSIDPETDTPEKLKAFAKENVMDDDQWTFLQGSVSGVREFANVLSVKYKEISPVDFSHSNIISIFNSQGELIHQQEGLGVNNKETIETILKITP